MATTGSSHHFAFFTRRVVTRRAYTGALHTKKSFSFCLILIRLPPHMFGDTLPSHNDDTWFTRSLIGWPGTNASTGILYHLPTGRSRYRNIVVLVFLSMGLRERYHDTRGVTLWERRPRRGCCSWGGGMRASRMMALRNDQGYHAVDRWTVIFSFLEG